MSTMFSDFGRPFKYGIWSELVHKNWKFCTGPLWKVGRYLQFCRGMPFEIYPQSSCSGSAWHSCFFFSPALESGL